MEKDAKKFLAENAITKKSLFGLITQQGVFKLGIISIKSNLWDRVSYAWAYISKDKKKYICDTGVHIGGVTGVGVYPENIEIFGKEKFNKSAFVKFYNPLTNPN